MNDISDIIIFSVQLLFLSSQIFRFRNRYNFYFLTQQFAVSNYYQTIVCLNAKTRIYTQFELILQSKSISIRTKQFSKISNKQLIFTIALTKK